jgi:hypothetical protein
VLFQIEASLHIEMKRFEAGIKYLGFFLKENAYSYEFGHGLLKKYRIVLRLGPTDGFRGGNDWC